MLAIVGVDGFELVVVVGFCCFTSLLVTVAGVVVVVNGFLMGILGDAFGVDVVDDVVDC